MEQRIRTFEAREKAYLEVEEMFQTWEALDEECLEQGMVNVEGWTRIKVEAETKDTIRAKDEAIKSRDQKMSRLEEDLARQAQDDLRRVRGERDKYAERILSLVATIDAQ